MGLDAYVYLVKSFCGRRDSKPTMIDGFPLDSQRMLVVEWCKNHWVHQWFISNVHKKAHECQDIAVGHTQLAELADKLEAWADDPEALPPVTEEFRGPFFGAFPDDEGYERWRDEYRAEAKEEAKQLRKAIEWLKVPCDRSGQDWECRYALYKASW